MIESSGDNQPEFTDYVGSCPRPTYLVFGQPQIIEADIEEVVSTLRSGWIGTGPRVAKFEAKFREYKDAQNAVAVNSCTAALHLSMLALHLAPGDEVIVPSMTFVATANAVIHAGGLPVLADVDAQTMCIDPDDVERRITDRTRAILPVHFGGRACDMDRLCSVASRHRAVIIEDAAHAVETIYHGKHAGTFGEFGCFSFYVTKNIVTGEGGMVLALNADKAAEIKRLALHGLDADAWKRFSDVGFRHYEVLEPGFKYNMMDLQAALGIGQLARVEENLLRRQQIWKRYDEAFADLPVRRPEPVEPGTRHARHLYTLLLDLESMNIGRDQVVSLLHERNIGTGIHYRAVHLHAYYRRQFGYSEDDLPVSRWISDRTISLPMSPKLSDSDVEDVIACVRDVLLAST